MEITRTKDSELTIYGHIKKTESYFDLKKSIDTLIEEGVKTIDIKIPDSLTITSSIIGLLLRADKEDGIKVNLHVGQQQLYQLLENLNMSEVFNVRLI